MVYGSLALSDANEKLREDLKAKHEELIALVHIEQKRLLHAFPNIQSQKHREVMEEIKAHVREKLEKRYGKRHSF